MNVTVYPKALRFFAQHDSYVVDNLHRQYLGLVELLEGSSTVIAEPCDYIVERVIEVLDDAPKLPEFDRVFISQVGDSLVFVFIKRNASGARRPFNVTYTKQWPDYLSLKSVYAVIFTGLSNIKKESPNDD